MLLCPVHQLHTVTHSALVIDMPDVRSHCVVRNSEGLCDLFLRGSRHRQIEHLLLSCSKTHGRLLTGQTGQRKQSNWIRHRGEIITFVARIHTATKVISSYHLSLGREL